MRVNGGEARHVGDQPRGRAASDKMAGAGKEKVWPLGARLIFIVAAALLCWALPAAIYFLLRR